MAKNFNADFYVTCATVIPVLFLAVIIQGRAYEAVLLEALRTRQAGAVVEAGLLRQVAYVIWAAGAFGEVFAVMVLYEGHEIGIFRPIVLGSTLILVVAVALGPLGLWARVTDRASELRRLSEKPSQAAGVAPGDERDGSDGDPGGDAPGVTST